jgi:hypothetical protein
VTLVAITPSGAGFEVQLRSHKGRRYVLTLTAGELFSYEKFAAVARAASGHAPPGCRDNEEWGSYLWYRFSVRPERPTARCDVLR